ncbi:MAG: carboxypeptidase regulatory-like domain-containing protein, partial [Candidatus Tectomicrobia bacterium]|nr:carboxypeptidase regulatory-like domain-containing protein [Candidatus Tectomicrobia bacterium]
MSTFKWPSGGAAIVFFIPLFLIFLLAGQLVAATVTINFDDIDTTGGKVISPAVDTYLAGYGITLTSVTPGSTVCVTSNSLEYGGQAVEASSPPNMLSQCNLNGAVTFTLNFSTPLDRFDFTRPSLIAGESGIIHPEWYATAFNSSGTQIDRVSEGSIASSSNVPAQTFILFGPGITSVQFNSFTGSAAFSAVLLDDFILNEGVPTVTMGSISGSVNFSGIKTGTIYIGAFTSSDFSGSPVSGIEIPLFSYSPDNLSYDILNLPLGTYYVGAFLDLPLSGNITGERDANEPTAFYGPAATGPEQVTLTETARLATDKNLTMIHSTLLELSSPNEFGQIVISTRAHQRGGLVMFQVFADLNGDGQSPGDPEIVYKKNAVYDNGPATNWGYYDEASDISPDIMITTPSNFLPGGSYILRATDQSGQTAEAPFSLPASPGTEFVITGRVTDGDTGAAIAGAFIEAWDSYWSWHGMAVSNYDGSYTLSVPATGSYHYGVGKTGFFFSESWLDFPAGSNILTYDFPLRKGTTLVNGRVYRGGTGEGIPGVE